jgi:hypothetical protein
MLLQSESSISELPNRRPLWSSRKSLAVFLTYLAAFLALVVGGGSFVELNPVERGVLQRVSEEWTVKPARGDQFGFENPVHIRPARSADKKRVYPVKWTDSTLQVQDGEEGESSELAPGAEVYVIFSPLKLWQFVRLGLGI